MSAYTEAKKRANKKWNDKNLKDRYDRIQIVVPKGERDRIQAVAKQNGETVSGLINRVVFAEVERIEAEGFGISSAPDNKNI